VATRGGLEVQQRLGAPPAAGVETPIVLAIVNDPFALVAGARLYTRAAADQPFVAAPERTLKPRLPALAAGGGLDYYLELVDRSDSVIASLGSARAPLHVALAGSAAPPPAPAPPVAAAATWQTPRSHQVTRLVLGVVGVAALGAAIGVDVLSKQDYDALMRDCAPDCAGQPGFDRYNSERTAAIALYPIAGVMLASSATLFIYDFARAGRQRSRSATRLTSPASMSTVRWSR
jgi:hypothetical protein